VDHTRWQDAFWSVSHSSQAGFMQGAIGEYRCRYRNKVWRSGL